jgi:hypothetical protein
MNYNTHIRMRAIFGTNEGNVEVCDRHIALHDIPSELMWQANRCNLNGNIKVVKLTFNPEVEQAPETRDDKEPEFFPVYGMPDLSSLYDEL